MKSTYNVKAQYKAKLLLIAPRSVIFLMFQISNMVMNIIAANKANETIHIIMSDWINQLTRERIKLPKISPIPIMSNGDKLPLVSEAMIVMSKKMPHVIPNAKPRILQSTKMVKLERSTPIKEQ